MSEVDFDWEDESVVAVQQVDAVAVFLNPKKCLVIRQRDPMGDDDHFILLPLSQVDAVIAKMQEVKRLAED